MLSRAESAVAEYLKSGITNQEIADKLCVSEKAIKFHLTNIYKKLNVKSRSEFLATHYGYQKPMESEMADYVPVSQARNAEVLPGVPQKAAMTQPQKVEFIDKQFKVGEAIQQLHHMMKEVTKEQINPQTVNAACNCVARLNETINTAIQAARFLNER